MSGYWTPEYKVLKKVVDAFRARSAYTPSGKTRAITYTDGEAIFLHDAPIIARAYRDGVEVGLSFSPCGYISQLTLGRLNFVCGELGADRPFFIRRGRLYLKSLIREIGKDETIFLPIKVTP